MRKNNSVAQHIRLEQQRQGEQEREKLVLQSVKLWNGATFTRLKPVRGT